jgi:hypothetical protein
MVSVAEVKIAGETHTLVGVKVPTGAMDHNTAVRGPDFFDPSAVGAWLTEHVLAPHETLAGVTVTQHSEGPVVSAIKAAAEAAGVHPDTVTGTIGSKTAICGPCQEMIEKAVAAVVMENPVPVPVKPPR